MGRLWLGTTIDEKARMDLDACGGCGDELATTLARVTSTILSRRHEASSAEQEELHVLQLSPVVEFEMPYFLLQVFGYLRDMIRPLSKIAHTS